VSVNVEPVCAKVLGALTQVSFYVKVKNFNNFQKSRDFELYV
jgi:hypothetical protein